MVGTLQRAVLSTALGEVVWTLWVRRTRREGTLADGDGVTVEGVEDDDRAPRSRRISSAWSRAETTVPP